MKKSKKLKKYKLQYCSAHKKLGLSREEYDRMVAAALRQGDAVEDIDEDFWTR